MFFFDELLVRSLTRLAGWCGRHGCAYTKVSQADLRTKKKTIVKVTMPEALFLGNFSQSHIEPLSEHSIAIVEKWLKMFKLIQLKNS